MANALRTHLSARRRGAPLPPHQHPGLQPSHQGRMHACDLSRTLICGHKHLGAREGPHSTAHLPTTTLQVGKSRADRRREGPQHVAHSGLEQSAEELREHQAARGGMAVVAQLQEKCENAVAICEHRWGGTQAGVPCGWAWEQDEGVGRTATVSFLGEVEAVTCRLCADGRKRIFCRRETSIYMKNCKAPSLNFHQHPSTFFRDFNPKES